MLILLRILFGAAFLYVIKEGREFAAANPEAGDLTSAGHVALAVILGILNAAVWAPYFGERISDPLTATITKGTYVERKNWLLHLALWSQKRGWRKLVLFSCFLDGIHYPDRPAAFVLGLKHARPGSWLEKVFAREVYRFDNVQNCIHAHQVLRRHGIDPGLHHNPEINLALMSLDRAVKPDPAKLVVTTAPPPPPLKRNRRIKLFSNAESDHAPDGSSNVEEPLVPIPAAGAIAYSEMETATVETAAPAHPESFWAKAGHVIWTLLSRLRAYIQGHP